MILRGSSLRPGAPRLGADGGDGRAGDSDRVSLGLLAASLGLARGMPGV